MGQCLGVVRSWGTGARECVCVCPGGRGCSFGWESGQAGGILLPEGEGRGCVGASWMGAHVGHVGGLPCSGMCVPRALWVVT